MYITSAVVFDSVDVLEDMLSGLVDAVPKLAERGTLAGIEFIPYCCVTH